MSGKLWKGKAAGETSPSLERPAFEILVTVRLRAPHQHAGVQYQPGETIEVPQAIADAIRAFGSAE